MIAESHALLARIAPPFLMVQAVRHFLAAKVESSDEHDSEEDGMSEFGPA